MKTLANRLFWGVLLVLLGIFVLLSNLDVVRIPVSAMWLIFAVIGIVFTYTFISDSRQAWWAIIPGLVFLGLAAIIGFDGNAVIAGVDFTPVLILGSIGLAFLLIFLVRRDFWWALIPAGTLLSIAAITVIPQFGSGEFGAAVMFLGFAATFGILALIPTASGRMRWPLFPAAALLLVSLIIITATTDLLRFVWPVLLILAGLYIFFRRAA